MKIEAAEIQKLGDGDASWIRAMRRVAFLGMVLLVFLLAVGCVSTPSIPFQKAEVQQAGIPVAQEFLAFYESNGGAQIIGKPLAEPYLDPRDGRLVQYFQRIRLEIEPITERVVLTPLGQWALPESAEQAAASDIESEQVSVAAETDIAVEDEFEEFFLKYGGEAFFGPPISPQLIDGGTRTQYFRYGRLEWHPEAPIDNRVQVGLLGEAHYQRIGLYEDPGRSRPLDSAGIREAVISASFQTPILYSGENQVIFVAVETPDGRRPVAGVEVELAVKYNGRTELVSLADTDGAGQTKGALPLPNFEPGRRVQVTVSASAPGGTLIGTTTESFRTWW